MESLDEEDFEMPHERPGTPFRSGSHFLDLVRAKVE